MTELGYATLFVSSFLAATVLPFSSEAVLSAMIVADYNLWAAVAVATAGNWLGSLATYWLGYLGNLDRIERWLKIKSDKIHRFTNRTRRWGAWFGLIVWVPGIGDVIAVCLGLIKAPFIPTAVMILVGKLGRYAVWAIATQYLMLNA